jgi:transposase, IS5 family
MIVDKYDPVNLLELVPNLTLEMEPELAELDRLLDDDELFRRVKADMGKRRPNSSRLGRRSTPVEVVLRMLVLRRLYDFSYEQTERHVSDSLVLRQFCRLGLERAPDDTTLIRWAGLIGADTLERMGDRVVVLARSLRVTRGRKMRTDGTVVETNIHHPTDSSLLADGVRVLGGLLSRAKAELPEVPRRLFRNRSRSAKKLAREVVDAARRRGERAQEALRSAHERLIGVAQAALDQAGKARELLGSGRRNEPDYRAKSSNTTEGCSGA